MTLISILENEVVSAIQRAGFSGNNTTLVVGVSGGPDSTALLHALHRLSPLHKFNVHVAHLNHNFRDEAAADAQFVASLAEELNLPATVEKRDPIAYQKNHNISSFEQAARELRYNFLAEVSETTGATAVVVGHTADDLAETVLLHILRGSGLHGLRGMNELSSWPWPREAPNLLLFRPLLALHKSDTDGYCKELDWAFRQDPANRLLRFTRNRIRHSLLPLLATEYNPKITDALVRLARTATLELDFLEQQTDLAWEHTVAQLHPCSHGSSSIEAISFDRAALSEIHPALQRSVLRRGFAKLFGDTRRLEENHLISMCAMASRKASGGMLSLPGGMVMSTTARHVVLSSNQQSLPCPFPPITEEYPVALPSIAGEETVTEGPGWKITLRAMEHSSDGALPDGDASRAILDLKSLGTRALLRGRQRGERFQPLGMNNRKKLQDFFTDSGVPRLWRDRVPLLVVEEGIAWIVGHRIAEWAKIDTHNSTEGSIQHVLIAEYETTEST